MLNLATKPAVKGIPAIDNSETAVATAAKGSVFAKPLNASIEAVLVNLFCNTLFDKYLIKSNLHWC